jgi:hypothetical protein
MLTREDARTLFDPHFESLAGALEGAWRAYHLDYAALLHRHSTRSRATIVHDLIVDDARNRFGQTPGVTIDERRGLFLLNFEGRALLRFKKLGRNLRPHSTPTIQTSLFDDQEPLQALMASLPLPHMPTTPTHVYAGYALSANGLELKGLYLVCPQGQRNVWVDELPRPQVSRLEPIDLPLIEQPSPSRRFRVRREEPEKDETRAFGSDA